MEIEDIVLGSTVDKRTEICAFLTTIGFAAKTKPSSSPVKTQVDRLYDEIIRRGYDGIDAVKRGDIDAAQKAKKDIACCFESIEQARQIRMNP